MTDEVQAQPDSAPEAAPEPTAPPSSEDAISKHFGKLFAEDGGEAPEVSDEAPEEPSGDERPRGPDGKFVAKEKGEQPDGTQEAQPEQPAEPKEAPEADKFDAPTRFSADAKAEWAKAPTAVKAEINRAIREMEGGLNQYKEMVEPLKPYFDMAKQHNTTIDAALRNYIGIEQELAKDPVKGFEIIARNMGTDLKTIAAQVMGQPAPEKDQVVEGLRGEIQSLKQQLGGVHGTVQNHQQKFLTDQVANFFRENPRADELSRPDIDYNIPALIQKGYSLEEAYKMADRLNPAPQPAAPPQPAATQPPPQPKSAQTSKATLSVQGAPASGSNPASRPRAASTDEAIRNAFATLGLPT